jgi:hypothetical protein
VLGNNPDILLVNIPVPDPLLVLVAKEIVGLIEVDQTTPLDVIIDAPEFVILPPEDALEDVIPLIDVVVKVGMEVDDVKLT